MPRENYQRRLESLRHDVVVLGQFVRERYDDAVEAAATGDATLAREVQTGDHEINERYLALEDECTELLALQQPVAGDLRLVTASFKILTDLERVADLATNLAGYGSADGTGPADDPDVRGSAAGGLHPAVDFRTIATDAGEMVSDAVTAYETGDPDACRAVAARDDELDDRCRRAGEAVVRDLLEADRARVDARRNGADTERIGPRDQDDLATALDDVSRSLLAIRDIERVGDHAVNIAARALYMAENDDELIY